MLMRINLPVSKCGRIFFPPFFNICFLFCCSTLGSISLLFFYIYFQNAICILLLALAYNNFCMPINIFIKLLIKTRTKFPFINAFFRFFSFQAKKNTSVVLSGKFQSDLLSYTCIIAYKVNKEKETVCIIWFKTVNQLLFNHFLMKMFM